MGARRQIDRNDRNVPARTATLGLRANVAGRLLDADATELPVPLERKANAMVILGVGWYGWGRE